MSIQPRGPKMHKNFDHRFLGKCTSLFWIIKQINSNIEEYWALKLKFYIFTA